jgi:hypothetical protein
MNKVWLYVGGIIVGTAVLIYAVITTVSSTHPPASDLRTAYETSKSRTLRRVECIVSAIAERPMPRTMVWGENGCVCAFLRLPPSHHLGTVVMDRLG